MRCADTVRTCTGVSHQAIAAGLSISVLVSAFCASGADAAPAAEISSPTLAARFSEASRGAIVSLKAQDGTEFALGAKGAAALFTISLTDETDFAKTVRETSWTAGSLEIRRGDGAVHLVYSGFTGALERVVCSVRAKGRGLAWSAGVETKPGWIVHELAYPRISLAAAIGAKADDDAIIMGNSKGGVRRNPGARPKGTEIVSGRQPGDLVAQFGAFYDGSAMLYTAAEDPSGEAKRLAFTRPKDGRPGVTAEWFWHTFSGGRVWMPYEAVAESIAPRGGEAISWHDAADRYREWAERQPWCARRIEDRTDLPAWMKDAPVMARIPGRKWYEKPDISRGWVRDYFRRTYPDAPLVLAMWGWEKVCAWIGPDYFPCVPDDATFAALVKDCRAMGAHCFPWPSGYHWTITFGPCTNGVWRWDGRRLFEERGVAAHSTRRRSGALHNSKLEWLNGGEAANLCYGDRWTLDWWNREVCLPLAKLGCEMIQVDQVVSGYAPTCFSKNHGHPPGEGRWRWEMFRRQLETMRDTMRAAEPDAVVAVEEPQELFAGIVGICDYRDCEAVADEWAGVYNYLYHEYAPVFQSNTRRENRLWQAWQAAEGQMPFFRCFEDDISKNGAKYAYDKFMENWIGLWRGRGRKFLFSGRRIKPPALECGTQHYHSKHWDGVYDGPRPNVFCAAYRAADGREALVFANATDKPQKFAYAWRGARTESELEPEEIRLLEL